MGALPVLIICLGVQLSISLDIRTYTPLHWQAFDPCGLVSALLANFI
jgi:hypothetical protein